MNLIAKLFNEIQLILVSSELIVNRLLRILCQKPSQRPTVCLVKLLKERAFENALLPEESKKEDNSED